MDAASSDLTQAVPDVDIDEAGVFKYILIRVTSGGASKYVVRGYASCEYHGLIKPP